MSSSMGERSWGVARWSAMVGMAALGACTVADLPPLDARDGLGGGDGHGGFDGFDGVDPEVVDPEPPPWTCEPRAPLAMQWGTSLDDEVTALLFAGDRLWVGGFEGGRRDRDPFPTGDARGFVFAIGGASPGGGPLGGAGFGVSGAEALTGGLVERGRWAFDRAGSAEVVEALAERDGTIHLVGRTSGAFPGFTNAGAFDLVMARLGVGGALDGVLQLGTERPQHPRSLVALGEDWLVAGWDDVDIDGNYVRNWTNPMHALIAGDLGEGELVVTDTPPDDLGGPVAVSPSLPGAFFLGTFGDIGQSKGAWVSRRDLGGGEVWRVPMTRFPLGNVGAMRFDADGHLVVAGTTFEALGGEGFGGQDVYVAVLDPGDGAVLSMRQLGGPGDEWVMDMVIDADGVVHVLGETNDSVVPGEPGRGEFDAFVLSVGDSGRGEVTRRWQHGSAGDDHPMAIALDPCGRLYVAGSTTGRIAGDLARGQRDAFLLEVR